MGIEAGTHWDSRPSTQAQPLRFRSKAACAAFFFKLASAAFAGVMTAEPVQVAKEIAGVPLEQIILDAISLPFQVSSRSLLTYIQILVLHSMLTRL